MKISTPLLILCAWLLSACAAQPAAPVPAASPLPSPPTASGAPASTAPSAAVTALAAQLNLPAAQISIVSVEPHDWPDGCLGLPDPGEMCAMHVVPGYRIVLRAGGSTYTFRTDQVGDEVRQEQPLSSPTPAP
ncbi:MAG TPA: hypothetical protein VF813_04110 [Anaerolineaceae bacterium]